MNAPYRTPARGPVTSEGRQVPRLPDGIEMVVWLASLAVLVAIGSLVMWTAYRAVLLML